MSDSIYMVHCSAGSVFVKEMEFFQQQGGFSAEWGKNWIPVRAPGIEEARAFAYLLSGVPYRAGKIDHNENAFVWASKQLKATGLQ